MTTKTKAVLSIIFLVFLGCQKSSNELSSEIERDIGFRVPKDTKVISQSDGGGRLDGYYEWVIFSTEKIHMPPMKEPGTGEYLKLPIKSSVDLIESRMQRTNIAEPEHAFSSEWENNKYTFRGTLVESKNGNYLIVLRFMRAAGSDLESGQK